MHGRKIVRSSAEAAAAKKAKDAQKIAAYRDATSKLAVKRAAGELDEEAFGLTSTLLGQNPEFYTGWNIRREILETIFSGASEEERQSRCKADLRFGEDSIKQNPKSYWVWNHRRWILEHMPQPEWEREFKLVTAMLALDARNFHGWDYRRWLVQSSGLTTPKDELDYTTKKINENFSNYSAWHYRSRLIPAVYQDREGLAAAVARDLETVRNAVFTEPADQSAWLYQRWLLGRADPDPTCICVSQAGGRLFALFNNPILSPSDALDATLTPASGTAHQTSFSPCRSGPKQFSRLWECRLPAGLDAAGATLDLSPASAADAKGRPLSCKPLTVGAPLSPPEPEPDSEALAAALRTEEGYLRELITLEPDSKWPLLTLAFFLARQHELLPSSPSPAEEILSLAARLESADPARAGHYHDLRSAWLVRRALAAPGSALDLKGTGLTGVPDAEAAFDRREVDLSGNPGLRTAPLHLFRCAETVVLDGTAVSRLRGLAGSPSLRRLSARGCPVSDPDEAEAVLRSCPALEALDLGGCPVAADPGFATLRQR
ncbi:hypothetical protein DFJ74DRAFT_631126, partial [Hyaloraphidium curvatum]